MADIKMKVAGIWATDKGRVRHIVWHPARLAAKAHVYSYANYVAAQRPYLCFMQVRDSKYGWCQWSHERYAVMDDFGDLQIIGTTERK